MDSVNKTVNKAAKSVGKAVEKTKDSTAKALKSSGDSHKGAKGGAHNNSYANAPHGSHQSSTSPRAHTSHTAPNSISSHNHHAPSKSFSSTPTHSSSSSAGHSPHLSHSAPSHSFQPATSHKASLSPHASHSSHDSNAGPHSPRKHSQSQQLTEGVKSVANTTLNAASKRADQFCAATTNDVDPQQVMSQYRVCISSLVSCEQQERKKATNWEWLLRIVLFLLTGSNTKAVRQRVSVRYTRGRWGILTTNADESAE